MATTVHILQPVLERVDERAKALNLSRNRSIIDALEKALAEPNLQAMKFPLDTNTVLALMRANPVVLAHPTERPRDEVVIPQPVVAEIECGLALLAAR